MLNPTPRIRIPGIAMPPLPGPEAVDDDLHHLEVLDSHIQVVHEYGDLGCARGGDRDAGED